MIDTKKIKAIPWPEKRGPDDKGKDYRLRLMWPVVDGERLLVAEFTQNKKRPRWSRPQPDFRMILSKKRKRALCWKEGARNVVRARLENVMTKHLIWCELEMTPDDETALAKWLGPERSCESLLPALAEWIDDALEAERQEKARASGDFLDGDVMRLCPEALPEGFDAYIRREILAKDNTIIYKKGNVRGLCYLCGQKVRARSDRFINHTPVRCPSCGEKCNCILEHGQSWQADSVANVATIQQGTDGDSLWVRQWRIVRDPEARYERIEPWLKETARYAARDGFAAKWQNERKERDGCMQPSYAVPLSAWERVTDVAMVYDGSYYFYLPESWRTITQGTSLQYIDLDGAEVTKNPIRFVMDWARYPAVEKLWKAGYTELVRERVRGGLSKQTRNAVKWSAETIGEALRIPPRLIRDRDKLDNRTLTDRQELWQLRQKGVLSERDALLLCDRDWKKLRAAFPYASIRQIVNKVPKGQETEARDYWEQCQALGLDLREKGTLFPKDLHAEHMRLTMLNEVRQSEEEKAKFAQQVDKLQKLSFSDAGLLIRPAQNAQELIEESYTLHHCVKTYAQRMADGKTAIFFIRRAEAPGTPWFTLEYCGGQVAQCRTTNNRSYQTEPKVAEFVTAWLDYISRKKQKKTA